LSKKAMVEKLHSSEIIQAFSKVITNDMLK